MTIKTANDSTFEAEVLKSDTPVLVDFWAEWCGPCQHMIPILDEIANEQEKVKIVKMNIEEAPETPTKYGVRGIPTLILFKNGEAASVKVGALPKSELLAWIDENS